jgi:hypothetical protein
MANLFQVEEITREEIEQANPNASANYILQLEAMNQALLQGGFVETQLRTPSGTGNPNGVVTSNLSQRYVDTATNTQYFNPNIGVNTGWVAV